MLTRLNDQKNYIGSTTSRKFGYRMGQHKRSKKFSESDFDSKIIFECDSYDQCLDMEESMISYYDTYQNGLNKTRNGAGNHCSPKFTTKGLKFSEETRAKIAAAGRRKTPKIGWKHSEEIKAHWSKTRSGEKHSVLNEETARKIITLYLSKPHIETAGKRHSKGYGRTATYESAFSRFYASEFGVKFYVIKNLICRKSWKVLWDEYT